MQSLIGFDPTSPIVVYGYLVITLIVALESRGAAAGRDSIAHSRDRRGSYPPAQQRTRRVGRYLFYRDGGNVFFFGHFTALLRAVAALLAGVNDMAWCHFLLFNMAVGVLWAALSGGGGYLLESAIQRIASPVGIAVAMVELAVIAVGGVFSDRHEAQFASLAERAFPGPLAPPLRHEAR